MNYNTLTTQIQNWTNRSEPTFITSIPAIIDQAMSRIYSEAKSIGFQATTSGYMVAGTPTIAKPRDYKETVSLFYYVTPNVPLSITFLYSRTYEFCKLYAPDPAVRGQPVFYSPDLNVPQNNAAAPLIFLSPTPDAAYFYEFNYVTFPPTFDANAPVNFLTDKYPNLLLYACLVEAIPYLKSDERAPLFESLYTRALADINKDTDARYTDRLTQRNKD